MTTLNLATLVVRLKADTKQYDRQMQKSRKETGSVAAFMKSGVGLAAAAGFALAANEVRKFVGESYQEFRQFQIASDNQRQKLQFLAKQKVEGDAWKNLPSFGIFI